MSDELLQKSDSELEESVKEKAKFKLAVLFGACIGFPLGIISYVKDLI